MSATLNAEPLVDVDDDELNTNQKETVDNTRAFGDRSFVCICNSTVIYRIQTQAGNQIVKVYSRYVHQCQWYRRRSS